MKKLFSEPKGFSLIGFKQIIIFLLLNIPYKKSYTADLGLEPQTH